MNYDDIIKEHPKIITKSGGINPNYVKEFKSSKCYELILNKTYFLNNDSSIKERLYVLKNNIKAENIICKVCNKNNVKFKGDKYGKFCSSECAKKRDMSYLKVINLKQSHENIRTKLIKNYNNNSYNVKELNDLKSFIKSSDTIERGMNPNLKHKDIILSAVKYTSNIIDFKTENDFKLNERLYLIHNNIKTLPLCKICNINHTKFLGFNKSYQNTCSKECGYKYGNLISSKSREKNKLSDIKFKLVEKFEFVKEYPINKRPSLLRCKKCNKEYEYWLKDGIGEFIKCKGCEKPKGSFEEESLYQFCKLLNLNNIKRGHRQRDNNSFFEIDILLNNSVGIEYNGLYWHSNNDKKYHLNKTEKFESKENHQLFHIFSSEWLSTVKRPIWESIIKNKTNCLRNKIYARNCIVKEIDNNTKNKFLDKNHIQGKDKSVVKLGLFYENTLVSMMTFGKSRFNTKYEWELIRFCNKINFRIVGGASKLLKHFERNYNPKSLISYANRRWSKGNLYNKLGFEFTHNTPPNYYYWKRNSEVLSSRQQFQKHKLKDKLEMFDEKLTEKENMLNNDYRIVYDCGNMVFIKEY